jgi:23S rRNA pseudouridine1911/1915/1917 synthase
MTLKKKTGAAGTKTKKTDKKAAKKTVKKTVQKVVKKAVKRTAAKPAAKTLKKAAKKIGGKAAPVASVAKQASFSIAEGDAGARIDRFLGEHLENASRTRIQKWMEDGHVRVNGEPARKSRVLDAGDIVILEMPPEETAGRVEPQDIPLEIVYEDKYLAVVNKPKGLVTHPGHGVPNGTLANALAYRFKSLSDFGGSDRPGIVHRLDRDTSGLLVVARDNATHAALSQQLSERLIQRTYRALIWREPPPTGTFDWPLGRHSRDPVKRAVIPPDPRVLPGKPAVTHYRVLNWFQFAAEVEVKLETGRTHQIRVHFSHAGFPVVGDTLYGGGEPMLGRVPPLFQAPAAGVLKRLHSQALHAAKLAFTHPRTGKKLSFTTPLPEEFQAALKFLKPFKRDEEEEESRQRIAYS